MMLMKDQSRKRHIAKTITWRLVGTIDTMILGWFISGNPMIGLKIDGLEGATNMLLYYAHERALFKVDYGLPYRNKSNEEEQIKDYLGK